jgi:drug/metabolite transporter (DMT)-like permease
MPIILAIGAAVGWGTADFFGGVSRRDASVFVIIAVSELAGVIVLIPIIIARGTPLPDSSSMLLACLAGIAVTIELGLIYAALSRGKAFITAPVGGLGTAIAATVGLLEGDRLDLMIALGLLCALIGSGVSAWTTSRDNQPRRIAYDAAVCAGAAACVGTMLICLHAAGRVNPYWATIAEHTSTALSAGLIAVAGHGGKLRRHLPDRRQLPALGLIAIAGVAGDLAYATASQYGALSIVSALSSLYPITTVALGIAIQRHRPGRVQTTGITLALVGAVLLGAATH